MKNLQLNKTNTYFLFSAAFVVLILAEIIFYQFYYQVPITVNGQKIIAKKGEALHFLLKKENMLPKRGRLFDVKGNLIPGKKGHAPVISINGKRSNLFHSVEQNDDISVKDGANETEKVIEKIEETQSKITYRGKGSFIFIIDKGRPGIRMVKKGEISNKIIRSKWIVTPIDFTIGRTNIRYRKVVALTFDDGPSKYTSLIMKILKENKARASFFVLGQNIKKRAKLLKEMAKRKYTIGSHTYSHISIRKAKPERVREELRNTDDEIYKAAKIKTKWFRPPGGALNSSAINYVLKKGYRISLWNIDTLDWQRKKPKIIKKTVLNNLRAGQVILLHDGGGNRTNTAAALPGIIKGIKKAGYSLVTLDDLYELFE